MTRSNTMPVPRLSFCAAALDDMCPAPGQSQTAGAVGTTKRWASFGEHIKDSLPFIDSLSRPASPEVVGGEGQGQGRECSTRREFSVELPYPEPQEAAVAREAREATLAHLSSAAMGGRLKTAELVGDQCALSKVGKH